MKTQSQSSTKPMQMDIKIYPHSGDGPITAFASVTLGGCFAIRGVKVMKGKNGVFVSMPSRQVKGAYQDICYPCTKAFKREFDRKILDAYQQVITQGSQEHQQTEENPQPEELVEDGPSMSM